MNIAAEVAKKLLQINAIKLSPQKPFTWASGLKSPIYCDNRMIPSYPEIWRFVINCFEQKAKNFEPFDVIAGVATGGIPHGALLAERLNLPFVYVRATAKEHGRQNMVEGDVKKGARVLMIEDLISTGKSSLAAVDAIRALGAEIAALLAIFSYGFEQATQNFEAAHCPMDTLTNYPTLLEEAIKSKAIQASDLKTLQQWRENPAAWSEAL